MEESLEVLFLTFRAGARSESVWKTFGNIAGSSWRVKRQIIEVQLENDKSIDKCDPASSGASGPASVLLACPGSFPESK